MHASSYENMARCYEKHLRGTALEARRGVVADIGGADVNGSYRDLFAGTFRYLSVDVGGGEGVDVVLDDPYRLPFETGSIDVVISGQAFEHIEFFWETFREAMRVLAPDGVMIVIAPSIGPEHRYPVDCWRFYPDGYAALAKSAGCDLIEVIWDERGQWRDLVGVFRHRGAPPLPQTAPPAAKPASPIPVGSAEEEAIRGRAPCSEVLARLRAAIRPRLDLEVGAPAPTAADRIAAPAGESDAFFAAFAPSSPVEFASIHPHALFDQTLRDFMHLERLARPGATVAIEHVSPTHPAQAERVRRTTTWSGDLWKLHRLLAAERKDLRLTLIDAQPSGLLVVEGLDPANRRLWEMYNPLVRRFRELEGPPPPETLDRAGALDPTGPAFERLLRRLARRGAALPLSVVIVAYDMARELPRTIRSFSPAMQRGVREADYELIVMDNGSPTPVDEEALRLIAPNLVVRRMADAAPSPARAINEGLALAGGDLIGVCIDGARMASPGLLSSAISAARISPRAVVGALSFHLGPDVQMRSVAAGYDQQAEDRLLAEARWEEDGYRLFDISVPGGSSAAGWFELPAETNSLFMAPALWDELGGFDARFESPGGGLANLDAWARACALPDATVIQLLGEATFHQVHGGVATNATRSPWDDFHAEYVRIRGAPFARPQNAPLLFGRPPRG